MNTRLLRIFERSPIKGCTGRVAIGLGQLQPVIIGFAKRGDWPKAIQFRCEDVENGRPCWRIMFFPQHKEMAKAALAALEAHARNGTRTPASLAWEEYERRRDSPSFAPHPPKATERREFVQTDLFGGLL